MRASHGGDRPPIAEADPDALLRRRPAIADATFVAEGVALGLPLMWAERAPPSGRSAGAGAGRLRPTFPAAGRQAVGCP